MPITRSKAKALAAEAKWYYTEAIPLPPEVLELVFWHMELETFSTSLMTCKQFWVVGTSRRNLLRQIKRIPGFRHGLEDLSTQILFSEFRRRAANAACAAQISVDVYGRKAPVDSMLRLAQMGHIDKSLALLAIPNTNGTVGIYVASKGDMELTHTFLLESHVDVDHRVQIFAVCFSDAGDLAILYNQQSAANRKSSESLSHRHHSSNSCRTYKVAMYSHHNTGSATDFVRCDKVLEDLEMSKHLTPSCMALASDGRPFIAWTRAKGHRGHVHGEKLCITYVESGSLDQGKLLYSLEPRTLEYAKDRATCDQLLVLDVVLAWIVPRKSTRTPETIHLFVLVYTLYW